jgi:hypothetical protein
MRACGGAMQHMSHVSLMYDIHESCLMKRNESMWWRYATHESCLSYVRYRFLPHNKFLKCKELAAVSALSNV